MLLPEGLCLPFCGVETTPVSSPVGASRRWVDPGSRSCSSEPFSRPPNRLSSQLSSWSPTPSASFFAAASVHTPRAAGSHSLLLFVYAGGPDASATPCANLTTGCSPTLSPEDGEKQKQRLRTPLLYYPLIDIRCGTWLYVVSMVIVLT